MPLHLDEPVGIDPRVDVVFLAYTRLRPVVSIWVCEQDPFPESRLAHLRFEVREREEGRLLHPDLRVDVLQLSRWRDGSSDVFGAPLAAWFQFFNEAQGWRAVPPAVDTPAIEEAMAILNEFRTDAALNALYRGRIVAERLEAQRRIDEAEAQAIRDALELQRELLVQERAATEAERAAKEVERAAKEAEREAKEAERAAKEAEREAKEAERAAKEAALAEVAALKRRFGLDGA